MPILKANRIYSKRMLSEHVCSIQTVHSIRSILEIWKYYTLWLKIIIWRINKPLHSPDLFKVVQKIFHPCPQFILSVSMCIYKTFICFFKKLSSESFLYRLNFEHSCCYFLNVLNLIIIIFLTHKFTTNLM